MLVSVLDPKQPKRRVIMKEGYVFAILMAITAFGVSASLLKAGEEKEVIVGSPIYICSQKQITIIHGITPPFEEITIPKSDTIDREFLIEILIEVESEGKNFIGDQGRAFGCLQIHECAIVDVNRHFGTDYEHLQVLHNSVLSKEICRKYWDIYASKDASYEELARLWNGGPGWRNDPKTMVYWDKVKRVIESRKRLLAAIFLEQKD